MYTQNETLSRLQFPLVKAPSSPILKPRSCCSSVSHLWRGRYPFRPAGRRRVQDLAHKALGRPSPDSVRDERGWWRSSHYLVDRNALWCCKGRNDRFSTTCSLKTSDRHCPPSSRCGRIERSKRSLPRT